MTSKLDTLKVSELDPYRQRIRDAVSSLPKESIANSFANCEIIFSLWSMVYLNVDLRKQIKNELTEKSYQSWPMLTKYVVQLTVTSGDFLYLDDLETRSKYTLSE